MKYFDKNNIITKKQTFIILPRRKIINEKLVIEVNNGVSKPR